MKNCEIKGIIPPILTPMHDDAEQTVNHEELRNQVERLLAGGVHGLFPFGTNGEGYILSLKEKEEVLETVIDQVKGRVPVYAGTGCISTADTIRMSKRAEELGADVLSIITPSFAVASQKELYDHYVEVAKHVNIPIVLYNIPPRTGNKLLPETVAKLAKDVDVIMGAKDSSGDRDNLKAYIDQATFSSAWKTAARAVLPDGRTSGPARLPRFTTTSLPENWKRPGRPRRLWARFSRSSSSAIPTPLLKRLWRLWAIRWATAAAPSTICVTRA